MNIYVASSWRNECQPSVVEHLRDWGHQVYDFKNPTPNTGFSWSQIDPNWRSWTAEQFLEGLEHPLAKAGFKSDMDALKAADCCVLVLPCGRSAHLELGYAVGAEKKTFILLDDPISEPELMSIMVTKIVKTELELKDALRA